MLGIAAKSLAAVRSEPNERAELINQLLFGEQVQIIEELKQWYKIESIADSYTGWVDSRLIETIPEEKEVNIFKQAITVSELSFTAINKANHTRYHLCPGSLLYNFNGKSFWLNKTEFEVETHPLDHHTVTPAEKLLHCANSFINSPYLWGGKSPHGVDCSGLVQVCYRVIGINLPRDAWQQAIIGQTIEFVNQVCPGDLAFFDNKENSIIHVGVLIDNSTIIHSSGYVRIDRFDHQGIFNVDNGIYTHRLRIIKRVIE